MNTTLFTTTILGNLTIKPSAQPASVWVHAAFDKNLCGLEFEL